MYSCQIKALPLANVTGYYCKILKDFKPQTWSYFGTSAEDAGML